MLNAATLGSLSAVPAIDFKEFAKVLTLNVSAQAAMLAAFDPMLRKAAKQARVIGITSSVARTPRAYWGTVWRVQGGVRESPAQLWRGSPPYQRRARRRGRSGRDPDEDARARVPGRGSGDVKPPEAVAERIVALAVAGFEPGHFERVE